MRVGLDRAVPREMLAAVAHTGLQQALHQAAGKQAHDTWVAGESAVANHATFAVVQIEHRGKAEIDTASAQLTGQHKASRCGRFAGLEHTRAGLTLVVLAPKFAQGAHGWQMGEAIGAKALHAATFVVHRNQQVRAGVFDVGTQVAQLRTVLPVAAKQDHAAHQRMSQAAAIRIGQCGAGNVKDQGGVKVHGCFKFNRQFGANRPISRGRADGNR